MSYLNKVLCGDSSVEIHKLTDESIDSVITSPPYFGLRDYGVNGQFGLESSPIEYVKKLCDLFDDIWYKLKPEGTIWLNLGDSYANTKKGNTNGTYGKVKQKQGVNESTHKRTIPEGLKPKDLIGIPWLVAFELQRRGWWLRQDIIWNKPSVMPESVTDRCTKSHEYIFLLTKSKKYYFDNEAIKEPSVSADSGVRNRDISKLNNTPGRTRMAGLTHNSYTTRNKRSVWTVPTKPYKGAHFATFPEKLIEPCMLAGCPIGGTVLDPFMGAGTVALVALKNKRQYIGIEINPEYIDLINKRIAQ